MAAGSHILDLGRQPQSDDERRDQLVRLFETEFDAVYRFCLARCGDKAVAEDLTSETFHAAADALASGREEEIGRPWLFVVARRRLVDHWRRAERERRRVLRLLELGEAQGQTHVEIEPASHQAELVVAALQSLPQRQRAAVALRYLDGSSVSEIAETLEVPYRAAESLLARGRRGFIAAWRANDEGF